jgi:hypothetical protein
MRDVLSAAGIEAAKSEAGRQVETFDRSRVSDFLWRFMVQHRSCRLVFNALIKEGFLNLDKVLNRLKPLLEKANTSFIFSASCKRGMCGSHLDRPNLAYFAFRLPQQNEISCPKCGHKNRITATDYRPVTPDHNDLVRMLIASCETGFMSPTYVVECFKCERIDIRQKGESLKSDCPKCHCARAIATTFTPAPEVEALQKQGYWLEWYVWRHLRASYATEPGVELKKGPYRLEADVVAHKTGKLFVLECKDGDDENFVNKLASAKHLADFFVLVTTTGLSPPTYRTCKAVLGRRFILVSPDQIENLAAILDNALQGARSNRRS